MRNQANLATFLPRVLALVVLCGLLPLLATDRADAQAGDEPHAQLSEATFVEFYEPGVLRIKLRDELTVGLRNGVPAAIDGSPQQTAALADLLAAVRRLTVDAEWTRLHDVSEAALDDLRREGEANTGRALPNLNNYLRLTLAPGTDTRAARKALAELPLVEWVDFMPRPQPTPEIPDYAQAGAITGNIAADRYQRYLDAAPAGIDARWAWLGDNGNGDDVRICDLEKNVNPNHADLPDITMLPPAPNPANDDNHGTAVMGIMAGVDNGFGVKGIAYAADLYFAATTSVDGFNVAAAITRCATALRAGDIIVIEAQTTGPNTPPRAERAWSSEGLVPVEWDKANYDAIQVATAAGRIVFEAGSNGAEDLDAAIYQSGNGGHHPFKPENDSGAIMVGGGNSPYVANEAPRAPSWFTNYGATLDVQGWGDGIVTTGYGDLYPGTGPLAVRNLWFKRSFGGTSGATPIAAGAAAVLQDTFRAVNGRVATPAEMKALLRATGTPQQGSENIGPLPNLQAAIVKIYTDAGVMPTLAPPTISPSGGAHAMPMQVAIGYGPGQNESNTQIRYTLDGSRPTEDSFIFIPSQGDSLYLNYGATVTARAFVNNPALGRTFGSEVAVAAYVSSTPKVATPEITPGGGIYSQGQQFTISTTTPGATIRYRTDGRTPSFFYPGTLYDGPLTLSAGSYEITARGYKEGFYKSDTAATGPVEVNAIQLPPPVIYPNSGDFTGELTVYIGSTVLGAEIRYTLDGSTPTENSPRFEEPINLTTDQASQEFTVKTRVFLAPYTPSIVREATYTVIGVLEPPTIDANQAPNTSFATITMNTATSEVNGVTTIRYTTNGAVPTSYSTVYGTPFTLGPGQYTVQARSYRGVAQPSPVTTLEVTVFDNAEPIVDPVMTPFSTQFFTEPFSVTLRTVTPAAVIRYTMTSDGSIAPDPTAPGQSGAETYSGPLTLSVNGQYRIKAQAYKSDGAGGFNASNVIGSGTLSLGEAVGTSTAPAIEPPGGLFTDTVEVRLRGAPNEAFFYTLDGSEPVAVPPATGSSMQANALSVIEVGEPSTLVARAYRIFFAAGELSSAQFDFICATPALTPGGIFTDGVTVSMSTSTSAAELRYTLDSSEPTASSTLYSAPIALNDGATMKAKCFRDSFSPSATTTELYVIEPAPPSPAVSEQPADQSADAGESVTLSVGATGIATETVGFQWQFNGLDLAGETEPTLEIPAAQPENAGNYRVLIRDAGGETVSESASVSINQVAITGLAIEHNGPTVLGAATNFAATAAAGGNISYSWDFGDGATADGPNPSHTFAAAGDYTVTVTAQNPVGSANAQSTVTVMEESVPVDNARIYLPLVTR